MKVFHSLDEYSVNGGTVLVMGMFDGMHLGHKALFKKAQEVKGESTVTAITFSGVFDEGKKALFTDKEKAVSIEKCGSDFAVFIPVDEKLKNTEPDDFIKKLKKHIKIDAVVIGFDYTFGKNAAGNKDTLKSAFESVFVVERIEIYGEKVSSSALRRFVSDGDFESYLRFCGEPYSVMGNVEHGRGLGKQNNVPTLNVCVDTKKLLPKSGVYATKVIFNDKSFISVSNLGDAPTFERNTNVLETHIIDFDGELYGENVKIEFYKFLRPIKKFNSEKELYMQIDKDIKAAKSYFRGLKK